MNPASTPDRPRQHWRRARRYAVWSGVGAVALLVAVYVAARLYLPTLLANKGEIEAYLTRAANHPVHLGRIESYWRGLNPGVRAYGVTVYSPDQQRAGVRIGEVQISVEPFPLLRGHLEVYRVVLIRPSLTLVRDRRGRIGVAELSLPEEAPSGAGLVSLLAMARVEVREGELNWRDERTATGLLKITAVELALRNRGARHQLRASADFPDALCHQCAVTADVTADPEAESWNGEFTLHADGVDVAALPPVLRERLPGDLRGRFDLDLWSDWRNARPVIVRGQAAATGMRFPFGAKPQSIALRQLSAGISWRRTDAGWRLDLDRLSLGLVNPPWSAGRLRVEYAGAENLFEIDHLDLDDLTRFVVKNQTQHPLLRHWAEVRPSGAIDALRIRTQGPLAEPSAFEVEAQLTRLGTAANERLPNVTGLSGRVSFDNTAGRIDIDSKNFSFGLPRVFRAPLPAARATGKVRWRKTDDAWHIVGDDLKVQGDDGKGTGSLTLDVPFDESRSPVLKLRVDFRDGNGAHAARYYPIHKLPPRALEWMESSFVDGRVTSGYLVYDGPIREFPFDEKQGTFELRAQVRDGVYRYLPGWAPITQARVSVAVNGADALITGSGRIGALMAHDVRVEVGRQPDGKTRQVHARGRLDGPVAETLRVLQSAKTKKDYTWQAAVQKFASAAGNGTLDLEVLVPLTPKIDNTFFATYRFQDAALTLADGGGVDALNGVVRFTGAGLHDGSLKGNLFGGPATLVSSYESDGLHLSAGGRFQPSELLRGRPAIAKRVSGSVDWSLDWRDGPEGARLQAGADYSGLRTRLPAPLDRGRGGETDHLTVTTDISRPHAMVLSIATGSGSGGKLAFDRRLDRWQFNRGRINFGQRAAPLPQREGLEIGLKVSTFDADQWLPLVEGVEPGAALALVSGVRAEIEQLVLLNREWGRSFLNLARRGDEWKIVVDSDATAGEGSVMVSAGRPARWRFDLAYLKLPPAREDADEDRPADPRRFPAVDLRARDFEYKQRSLGELNFAAAPDSQGWRIDRFKLTRPELTLAIDGVWRRRGVTDGSEFNIDWKSDDMGTSLDALGFKDQMAKGKVHVLAHLSWPGAPTQPQVAGMNGTIEVSAENGRFLKLDPGAARLFGLLDLRSIARYLTFDFSPAFGKGYAFDAIHGKIAIDRGNARTDSLVVSGPALNLGIAGRVGLAKEDYDLVIEASPRIGSTLTLTSWGLFGPQVAAAVLALQSLFRKQINEGTRITYFIKGPWSNPQVTKLSKEASASPPAEPTQ